MIEILYENQDIVACVKPIGVSSQCDNAEDMVKILTEQIGTAVFPVHRLDTAVGGTMVFAKNKRAAANLSNEIANGGFVKIYLAVVEGVPSEKDGRFEDLLFKDSRKNKSFVVKRERKGVRKAVLDYSTVDIANVKTLVRIKLHTGRSHQIRVQFSSRKMPLLGDGKYGSKDNGCSVALWSEKIEFNFNNRNYSFESKPDSEKYPWNLFNL